jgi:type VI secretion system secreted protein VgrG
MSGGGIDLLSITTPLPESDFVPVGLSAQEQLSRPFLYLVSLNAGTQLLDPNALIDQPVTVILGDPASYGRYFNGVVQAISQLPTANAALWSYQLTVVPSLWFLGQTQTSRFFQNMTVPDIVTAILGDFNVACSNLLQETYGAREYVVMFNETYLHFIQRILEDEGIFYFFQHDDSSHTMILGDRKSAFSNITAPDLTVRDGAQASYDLASWSRADASALGAVTFNDYDPSQNTLVLDAITGVAPTLLKAAGAANRKFFGWPAVRTTTADAGGKANWRMEAAEAAAQTYIGAGGATDFYAGGSFNVTNDPTNGGDAASYVLRSVTYQVSDTGVGSGGGSSTVSLTCTAFPIDTQWRETPSFAPPVMAGVYSGLVIGPAGEEIYTDDAGRIKVWFPWDFNSDIDESKSLWLRVMQPWGGTNWGVQFTPRVGMEVIVAFLEGDVNRPIVMGSVYNSQNPPIYNAASKNISGFRTRSTQNGGSDDFNELSFDDTANSELMFLHAQKDYTLETEHDQTVSIGNDRNVTVQKDETVAITGKQTIQVQGDQSLTVTQGNMTTAVSTGSHSLTVDTGNHSMKVSTGDHSTEISMGNVAVKIDMGNLDTSLPMGNASLKLDLGAITYEAMQSITLKVGPNSITINQAGVTVKGIMVQITGQAMTTVKGPMVEVAADAMLKLAGAITMIN